ncbi:tRNA pseudouridine(38-40) synthase TruA [Tissierella pigra]|uniref:tRNA pseudouridine synthase A n=1 Tax=Tissierella pigra TaxID=2607614 RepID=A0A6N7XJT8_9FIRM|nr:tRNA pseudouridine(38-40) synthase TruA [Tissierella pigra]MBU5425684.1 tRNA pseudouridine(38-40) synthase TruA [Tissierella pigra]MSU01846.1 tRNA pseudouridine(38-40) synthase TruA [Tissierella pigra]
MKNIKLTIEYEGTNYAGWQRQDNVITIQEKLEGALEILTNEKIKLIGSGRTDGGVHALAQVANFITNATIPGERYKYALKFLLPDDITIMDSEEVDIGFNSRFSATKKTYKYIVYNGELPKALYRNFSYYVPYDIDIDKMIDASKYLIGTHDFASFMAAKSSVKSTIRTIYSISIEKEKENELIIFKIEGNSFLRNMVRIIVGTLLEIGFGKLNVEDLCKIISEKNRELAGHTAPPQGLFLEKVFY